MARTCRRFATGSGAALSILTINAGSSSLKFGLFGAELCELARGTIDWAGDSRRADLRLRQRSLDEIEQQVEVSNHGDAVAFVLEALREHVLLPADPALQVKVVGHRVVHGGTLLRESGRIDGSVKAAIA